MRLRFEPRQGVSLRQYAAMVLLSIVLVVGVLTVVFTIIGVNPWTALWGMVSTAFKSGYHFSEAMVRATPLIFASLSVALCLKMRLWNIGAEGQLFMGAFGAVLVAQSFPTLPGAVLLPVMMAGAMVAGG